jgi:hypothetical protein
MHSKGICFYGIISRARNKQVALGPNRTCARDLTSAAGKSWRRIFARRRRAADAVPGGKMLKVLIYHTPTPAVPLAKEPK